MLLLVGIRKAIVLLEIGCFMRRESLDIETLSFVLSIAKHRQNRVQIVTFEAIVRKLQGENANKTVDQESRQK